MKVYAVRRQMDEKELYLIPSDPKSEAQRTNHNTEYVIALERRVSAL